MPSAFHSATGGWLLRLLVLARSNRTSQRCTKYPTTEKEIPTQKSAPSIVDFGVYLTTVEAAKYLRLSAPVFGSRTLSCRRVRTLTTSNLSALCATAAPRLMRG